MPIIHFPLTLGTPLDVTLDELVTHFVSLIFSSEVFETQTCMRKLHL